MSLQAGFYCRVRRLTEFDTSSGLGTLRNQVRETRPLKIGITILIDRGVVYAEHAQHVLTHLP
jgi:hypothetical protein